VIAPLGLHPEEDAVTPTAEKTQDVAALAAVLVADR
jgi:hypothetical protein